MVRHALHLLLVALLVTGLVRPAAAIDHPYTEGTAWNITFVKTIEGLGEDYLKNLSANWKRMMDEAKKEGLILSYRVFSASAANPQDWDLMLMVETKDMASLDGMDTKFDAIAEKLIGSQEKQREGAIKRNEIRQILGSKMARELILK